MRERRRKRCDFTVLNLEYKKKKPLFEDVERKDTVLATIADTALFQRILYMAMVLHELDDILLEIVSGHNTFVLTQ